MSISVFAIDVLLLIGTVIFVLGIILITAAHVRWKSLDASAYGKIVEIETYINHDGYPYSVPIVEFTVGMETIRSRAFTAQPEGIVDKKLTKGQSVEVIYNSRKPTSFIVKGYDKNSLLLFGSALSVVALIVTAVVFFVLYKLELLPVAALR